MDQTLLVFLLVGAAGCYLVVKMRRAFKSGGGCGKCGCGPKSSTKSDQASS